jgi:hypothetical protein
MMLACVGGRRPYHQTRRRKGLCGQDEQQRRYRKAVTGDPLVNALISPARLVFRSKTVEGRGRIATWRSSGRRRRSLATSIEC